MTDWLTKLGLLGDSVAGMPPGHSSDLIVVLLVLVLGMALGIGLTCLLLVVHFLRGEDSAVARMARRSALLANDRRGFAPLLSVPSRWLAIKSTSPKAVLSALGLRNPTPCSWQEGLAIGLDHKLFISPPVSGWILVLGAHLPEPADDPDRSFRFLIELSRKVGQVQFFSLNRVVNHHAWVHVSDGRVLRAYAWAGGTLWNQGKPTQAEVDLGLHAFDYTVEAERGGYGRPDPVALNTERVPLLAARWSVDPSAIDVRILRQGQGIAGRLSRSQAR